MPDRVVSTCVTAITDFDGLKNMPLASWICFRLFYILILMREGVNNLSNVFGNKILHFKPYDSLGLPLRRSFTYIAMAPFSSKKLVLSTSILRGRLSWKFAEWYWTFLRRVAQFLNFRFPPIRRYGGAPFEILNFYLLPCCYVAD